jgi:hypothetical protein
MSSRKRKEPEKDFLSTSEEKRTENKINRK